MKVALVYDRVNKFGGAERVLLQLHKLFPDAPLFTLVYQPATTPWANNFKIFCSPFNKISFFRSHHELLAPLAIFGFELLNLTNFDIVISVTSEAAKSVITPPETLHICYCLTPTRYLWSEESIYAKDWKMRYFPRRLIDKLKKTDIVTAQRPDAYIAISKEVQQRIKTYYHRDSSIVYPPVGDYFFKTKLQPQCARDYYLVVSRLVSYKKVDLVIKAFTNLKQKLIIVGSGTEDKYLHSIASPNVSFIESASDNQLRHLYSHAKAVIFPQVEDYGIVPLEAQAAGTPVIALSLGGALETIIPYQTGVFFKTQTVQSLLSAVKKFEETMSLYSPQSCRTHARQFSESRFANQFSAKVKALLLEYRTGQDKNL